MTGLPTTRAIPPTLFLFKRYRRHKFPLCSYATHGREPGTLNELQLRAKSLTQSAPTQTINQPGINPSAFDCILGNILGFMLPFFLVSAGGNTGQARAAIKELIDGYHASTPAELDLVGRIIGFSIAAMDNLRLSMAPDLSATKVLRYRCNAATLSRSSDQALKILEAVQARQEQSRKIPRPSVAAASPPPTRPATSTMSARPRPVATHGRFIERRADQWRRFRIPRNGYRDYEARRPHHDGGVFEKRHAQQHHDPGDARSRRIRRRRCPCRHRRSQTSLAEVS